MIRNLFSYTPLFGFVPRVKTRFRDRDLFEDDYWVYVILKKIKLWYGTPKNREQDRKIVLGIQCVYKDLINNKETTTEEHCGYLGNDDVETKEYCLKDNEYFCKFDIDFDNRITHLKFTTNTGKFIAVGEEREETKKIVDFNFFENQNYNDKSYMIHSFTGYFNDYGLFNLGCIYILRKNFLIINKFGILVLRHHFNNNKKERKKWENPEVFNQLSYEMKAICKLCTFNDDIFILIMKYL